MTDLNRVPWLSAVTACICGLVYWLAPFGSELFVDLTLKHSTPWNLMALVGANFTHIDLNHFVWNLAALLVLGSLIERRNRCLMLVSLLVGVISINAWFFIQNQFTQYAGLSGALNTLLVVALYVLRVPQSIFKGNLVLWLIFLLVVAKNFYELIFNVALFSDVRWQTTPSFHLVGMLAGCLLVVVWNKFFEHKTTG